MSTDTTKDPNHGFLVKLGKGEPALRIMLSKKDGGQSQGQGESGREDQLIRLRRGGEQAGVIPRKKDPTGGGDNPCTGHLYPPVPAIDSYPELGGSIGTGGGGASSTTIHRVVWFTVAGGYTSGPCVPIQRQIKISRDGVVHSDITLDFTGGGWGIGSYGPTFIYTVNRIFRIYDPPLGDYNQYVFVGGSQTISVRDQFQYSGNPAIWTDWASVEVSWPTDFANDPLVQAYIDSHGLYVNEG